MPQQINPVVLSLLELINNDMFFQPVYSIRWKNMDELRKLCMEHDIKVELSDKLLMIKNPELFDKVKTLCHQISVVLLDKNKVVRSGSYEIAARLRDQEKRLRESLEEVCLDMIFSDESIHEFKDDKIICFKKTGIEEIDKSLRLSTGNNL